MQVGVVRSQLVLEGAALLAKPGDAVFGLESDLADGLSDQLWIGADLVDLVDDESSDLASGDRGSGALVPSVSLGMAAEVVAVAAAPLAGIRVGHLALAAANVE